MIFEYFEILDQGGIASKVNRFDNETTIYSFHTGSDGISSLTPDVVPPIDVIYKSKQSEEKLTIVLTCGEFIYSERGSMTLNLNGNTNIVLKTNSNTEVKKNEICKAFPLLEGGEDDKEYQELITDLKSFIGDSIELTHYYFPISKEDFLKCCQASSIAIQVKTDENNVWQVWTDGNGCHISEVLLPTFRALYNKAIDNSMFVGAEKIVLAMHGMEVNDNLPQKKENGPQNKTVTKKTVAERYGDNKKMVELEKEKSKRLEIIIGISLALVMAAIYLFIAFG